MRRQIEMQLYHLARPLLDTHAPNTDSFFAYPFFKIYNNIERVLRHELGDVYYAD